MFKEFLAPRSNLSFEPQAFRAAHPMFKYQHGSAPKDFQEKLQAASKVLVIGMGGSILPLKVFVDAAEAGQKIKFWDSLELPPKSERNDFFADRLFCLVSKSGGTLEVHAMASYLLEHFPLQNFVVVSDPESPMHQWAKKKKLAFCPIPPELGGRFTNFSPFHQVLLESLGFEYSALTSLARRSCERLVEEPQILESLFQHIYASEKKNLVLWSYGQRGLGLTQWIQQALAESLAKIDSQGLRRGMYASLLKGPQDQHSVLQALRDGPQENLLWFVQSLSSDAETLKAEDCFAQVHSKSLTQLMKVLCESTYQSFEERLQEPESSQPLVKWELSDSMDDFVEAIVRVQAFVEYAGDRLKINAFDQPGVERGKQIAKDLLKRF